MYFGISSILVQIVCHAVIDQVLLHTSLTLFSLHLTYLISTMTNIVKSNYIKNVREFYVVLWKQSLIWSFDEIFFFYEIMNSIFRQRILKIITCERCKSYRCRVLTDISWVLSQGCPWTTGGDSRPKALPLIAEPTPANPSDVECDAGPGVGDSSSSLVSSISYWWWYHSNNWENCVFYHSYVTPWEKYQERHIFSGNCLN